MTEQNKSPEQIIEVDQSTDNLESVNIMSGEKKRVCIIGAGASGLVSMKVSSFKNFNKIFKFLNNF